MHQAIPSAFLAATMPRSARAELHLLDGDWALEADLDQIALLALTLCSGCWPLAADDR
jgi:hypothetical protein